MPFVLALGTSWGKDKGGNVSGLRALPAYASAGRLSFAAKGSSSSSDIPKWAGHLGNVGTMQMSPAVPIRKYHFFWHSGDILIGRLQCVHQIQMSLSVPLTDVTWGRRARSPSVAQRPTGARPQH